MKKAIAKQWVKALRSGKYKQGDSFLRFEDEFCCLGVLCDLHDPTQWKKDGVFKQEYDYRGDHCCSLLPDDVRRWAGMQTDSGDVRAGCWTHTSLAAANDGGVPFEEIAAFIEENYETL